MIRSVAGIGICTASEFREGHRQNFVFNTTVIIHITFIPLDINKIELKVKTMPTRGEPGDDQTQGEELLYIDWLNWNNVLYNSTPPTAPWGIILDTESGYTEK